MFFFQVLKFEIIFKAYFLNRIQKLDQKNRNLQRSNQTSAETYNTYALKDFQLYTNSLNTMKQDLEFIFQRIRLLKNRFQTKYPSEYRKGEKLLLDGAIFLLQIKLKFMLYFKAIADNSQILVDDDDVEEEFNLKQTNEDRIQEVGTIEKERKKSIETATSAASNASAALVNLIQSARDRISSTGKEIVSGFITNSNNNNVVASPNDNKEESEDQKVIKEQEEDSHK